MANATSTTPAPIMCSVSAAQVEEIARLIDQKGGLIAKARAAKHLSQVVMNEVSSAIEGPSIKAKGEYTDLRFHQTYIDHLIWMVSEVWEICRDLNDQIDTLHGDFTDIADASFHARQDAEGRKAA